MALSLCNTEKAIEANFRNTVRNERRDTKTGQNLEHYESRFQGAGQGRHENDIELVKGRPFTGTLLRLLLAHLRQFLFPA